MRKNILIITGSPRKGGNTELLAEAFARGATAAGHTVTTFNAAKGIAGCKACDTCWTKGTPCSFRDGFAELEPLLEQADTLVFATPVYWFTYSAQIKAAIDRMYAYTSAKALRKLRINEGVLLACAADNEQVFAGLVRSFELMIEYLKWRNAGVLTVPGVIAKGDILNTAAPDRAEELGRNL